MLAGLGWVLFGWLGWKGHSPALTPTCLLWAGWQGIGGRDRCWLLYEAENYYSRLFTHSFSPSLVGSFTHCVPGTVLGSGDTE